MRIGDLQGYIIQRDVIHTDNDANDASCICASKQKLYPKKYKWTDW